MKILVINWQDIKNPFGGGAEVHLHEIFSRLAKRGHDITLLASSFHDAPEEEIIDGIRVIRKGNRNLFNFYVRGMYHDLRQKNKFDVVVDDINKIPFYTPAFVKEPLAGIALHFFGKTIYKETNPVFASYVFVTERVVPLVYKNIPFATISNSTQREMVEMGFSEDRVEVIPTGVDTNLYNMDVPSPPQDHPIIGYLGRIKKYKSVDHVISAFAKIAGEYPKAELLIVGDGDNVNDLKAIAHKTGFLSRISFTGKVSEKEKVELVRSMTFLANPSAKEGWGLTVIEANACGKTVIAADVPGLRDSVVDNRTGLLYRYGDIDLLAEKMRLLLSDARIRHDLEQEAIRWASKFTWDNSADKMESFLQKTASGYHVQKNSGG